MGKLLEISLECYKKFKGYRKEFFDFFLEYIEPEKIEIKAPFTNRKYKNFYSTKEKFFELISKKEYEEEYIQIILENEEEMIIVEQDGFRVIILEKTYTENEKDIDNYVEKLFIKIKGCIAKMEDWDYSDIQNERNIEFLELDGIKVPKEKIKIYGDGSRKWIFLKIQALQEENTVFHLEYTGKCG